MDDPNEISRLLRLKKYEQPAPEYFERFLQDFHRRQRSEFLHQPLWRIAVDRANSFFFGQPKWDLYSYGAATAAALVLFFGILNFDSRNQGQGGQGGQIAGADKPAASENVRTAASDTRTEQPRYVIDTRPVSYHEPPFSF